MRRMWSRLRPVARMMLGRAAAVAAVSAVGWTLAGCAVGGPGLSGTDGTGTAQPKSEIAQAADQRRAAAETRRRGAKVAMLLPLSGPGQMAVIAKAMKQAGELQLFEQETPEFQLIVKDDRGTPDGAKAAAEDAVREGADLILGPLLSASVQAVAPIAAAANIPVIAFSNDQRVAGSGVFLLSFMAEQDVERIITYAAAQGRRNFAALLPDDSYGRIAEASFARWVGQVQGNVVAIERYAASGTGMLEPTRRLAEAVSRGSGDGGAGADALFLPGTHETLTSLGPLLAYARIDTTRIKLLGSGGWDAPNLGRDQSFVGGWYPAPEQRGWQAFAEKFAKTFGGTPPRLASVAFDAVGVAIALAGAGAGQRFTSAEIMRPAGFSGADGPLRFLPDGTARRSLAVLEVQGFGATTIDPPASPSPTAPGASTSLPAGVTQLPPLGASLPGQQQSRQDQPGSRLN